MIRGATIYHDASNGTPPGVELTNWDVSEVSPRMSRLMKRSPTPQTLETTRLFRPLQTRPRRTTSIREFATGLAGRG